MTKDELATLLNSRYKDERSYNDYKIIFDLVGGEGKFAVAAVFRGEVKADNFVFQKLFNVENLVMQLNDKVSASVDKIFPKQHPASESDLWDQWAEFRKENVGKNIYDKIYLDVLKEIDKLK